MAASTEKGTFKYWFGGLPVIGNQKGANDNGTIKYWFNGLPAISIWPSGAPPARIPRHGAVIFQDPAIV